MYYTIITGVSRLSLPVRPKESEPEPMPIALLADRVRKKVRANPAELGNRQAGIGRHCRDMTADLIDIVWVLDDEHLPALAG